MEQTKVSTAENFNEKFLESYRKEQSDPINENHHFDTESRDGGSEKPAAAAQLAVSVAQPSAASPQPSPASPQPSKSASSIMAFGYPVVDFIGALLPGGVPVGSRHKQAIRLAYNLMLICDGDPAKVSLLLMQLQWVRDVVTERGERELDDIIDSAKKLMRKRESENIGELMPSREMRRAIESVTRRKYSQLMAEARRQLSPDGDGDDVTAMLERLGRKLERLFPRFPQLKLLCRGLKRKHYVVALFVAGAFAHNLMTRCWYRFWPMPGRRCRLNSLLELIGRMGSGKQIAVLLYRLMMEPIAKSDAPQVAGLNKWNSERDQNSGASKNKTPRPQGIYRRLPSETSAAAIREAEFNAVETIDGQEWPLHVSIFDSELDNTLRQMKKSYMDQFFTLWLKAFHNEPHGSYLKTSSAKVGEYDVHANFLYTGTSDALAKQATEANFVNGLLSRITCVPMGDTKFEMMENREYTEVDAEREEQIRQWAYQLDSMKGEIPCREISDALYEWTARRMADAKEEDSMALEDLVKRPCWHAINFALPYIVSRHWDQMEEHQGRMRCRADFKTDRYDVELALLLANAQMAFQQYFFLGIGEQHYDNLLQNQSAGRHHQQRTKLAYQRLPDPFTSDDVKREYGYTSPGSVNSRLKRLQDDGLAQRIRSGEQKGMYRKLA